MYGTRIARPEQRLPRGVSARSITSSGGRLAVGAFADPALKGVGGGVRIFAAAGVGTVGFAGIDTDGRRVFVTSRHVVLGSGQEVSLDTDDRATAGHSVLTWNIASRSELYGPKSTAPQGRFLVDAAMILPADGIQCVGGMPDGSTFSVRPTERADHWLAGASVFGWGSITQRRTGRVARVWPQDVPPLNGTVPLCTIEQDPQSTEGDSGGPWFASIGGEYFALGLHWGVTDDSCRYAVVADLIAVLDGMSIDRLLTTSDA